MTAFQMMQHQTEELSYYLFLRPLYSIPES